MRTTEHCLHSYTLNGCLFCLAQTFSGRVISRHQSSPSLTHGGRFESRSFNESLLKSYIHFNLVFKDKCTHFKKGM